MTLTQTRIFLVVPPLVLGIFFVPVCELQAQDPSPVFGNFETDFPGISDKSIDRFAQQDEPFVAFINLVITLVTGAIVGIGVIMVVVGGYVYMTAAGNAQRVGTAKTIIGAALLGIMIAVAAQLILNTISPQFAAEVVEPFFR